MSIMTKTGIIKYIVVIVVLVIVLSVFSFLLSMYNANRTVGYVEGNKIYYNGKVYVENFENFTFELGKCKGSVLWKDDNHKSKIYDIRGNPNYIVLSMITDYRIYKATN